MARSSGFKINRHLYNFLRIINADNTIVDTASMIFELRSICGKYQPMENIQQDIAEILTLEAQPQGEQSGDSQEAA